MSVYGARWRGDAVARWSERASSDRLPPTVQRFEARIGKTTFLLRIWAQLKSVT